MTNAFNFADLDLAEKAEVPFEFELEHPETKDGLGVFVSVIGAESDTFLAYVRQEGNKARKRAFAAQRKGKQDDEPSTMEEDEDAILRAVAVCIVGWRTVREGASEPVIHWGGERIECNHANAVKWLRKFRWVREQVNKATGDLANFLPKDSASSQPSPAASSN